MAWRAFSVLHCGSIEATTSWPSRIWKWCHFKLYKCKHVQKRTETAQTQKMIMLRGVCVHVCVLKKSLGHHRTTVTSSGHMATSQSVKRSVPCMPQYNLQWGRNWLISMSSFNIYWITEQSEHVLFLPMAYIYTFYKEMNTKVHEIKKKQNLCHQRAVHLKLFLEHLDCW